MTPDDAINYLRGTAANLELACAGVDEFNDIEVEVCETLDVVNRLRVIADLFAAPRKLNINDHVRVRLTDLGRKTLAVLRAKTNEDIAARCQVVDPPRLPLAVEEKDGWSTWQLWDLMATFGEFQGLTRPLMFETEIEIP